MPRDRRIEFAGAIHHVTLRGNRGAAIFLDDRDRRYLLRELDVVARRYGWVWLSYCLMTNHAHLVIETPDPTLGLGMRQLAGRHAQTFNKRHGAYGHLFQERYGSVVVRSDAQLAQLLRYVALNPVKAGLCAEAAEWRWSSHSALLRGRCRASRRVEELLAVWGAASGARYSALFEPTFIQHLDERSPWAERPSLARLLDTLELDDAMRTARRHGYRLSEIAGAVGLHETTVSRRTRAS